MKYRCDNCDAEFAAPTDTDTVRCPGCGETASKATTPADELRAAAALLRDRATAAIHEGRTRWTTGHTLGSRSPVVLDDPEQPSVLIETYAARLESVNRYLALLGPDVGLALADWLNETARYASLYTNLTIATTGALPAVEEYDSLTRHALAVARQLLGTTEAGPALPADTGPGQRHSVELGVFCHTCHVEWRGNFLVADGMSPADQITMVRAHVRSLGWQCEEPRDFCPEHKPTAPAVTEGQTTETAWVLETLWRNGEWRRHHPARATRYEAEQDYERSVHQDAGRKYRIVRVMTTTTVEPAPAVTEEPGR